MKDVRIRLIRRSPLQLALDERVEAYFEETGRSPRGGGRMLAKTSIIFGWWTVSWLFVLSEIGGWAGAMAGAVSLGLATVAIGFSVMHDAGHRAYSHKRWMNRLMHASLDLIGGSSYIWNVKHNVMHHTYPNVVGSDDDIDVGGLSRMAPEQPLRPAHRFQHFYMWVLYGFISIKWHWYDDFAQFARGKLLEHPFPRPRGKELWIFIVGKALFFAWALIIPLIVLPWTKAVAVYLVSQVLLGVVLAVTFQMAHCVEAADFLRVGTEKHEVDYAKLQLDSTVDFAPGNRFVTWYMGGLNYQAVHHLYPRVSHVHYPDIAPIIAEVCREHGVKYRSFPTVREALGSHYRWLRRMGREAPPAIAPASAVA